MNPEAEFLTHLAAGTDPLAALAAMGDQKTGCLPIVLVLIGLLLPALR